MKYAKVRIGEYEIPLIGIPEGAALEECDCCHETIGLSDAIFTTKQILCHRCAEGDLQTVRGTVHAEGHET